MYINQVKLNKRIELIFLKLKRLKLANAMHIKMQNEILSSAGLILEKAKKEKTRRKKYPTLG